MYTISFEEEVMDDLVSERSRTRAGLNDKLEIALRHGDQGVQVCRPRYFPYCFMATEADIEKLPK
jgi:hypothetical protein